MRSIGSFSDQIYAKRFSQFLRKQGIENTCEITFNRERNAVSCAIWIHEEDQIEKAEKFFEEFQKNPQDSKYSTSLSETLKEERDVSAIESPTYMRRTVPEKSPSFFLTYFFVALCVVVFFMNSIQEMGQVKKKSHVGSIFHYTG